MGNKVKAVKSFRKERQQAGVLTQSFNSRAEVTAAMYGSKHKPNLDYRYGAAPNRDSAAAAEEIIQAMERARDRDRARRPAQSGYQEDGSYIDRDGVRQSKAYMDNLETNKAELPGKGEKGQRCNRTACQAEGAYWFNHSTRKHYCGTCADIINAANGPQDSFIRDLGHPLLTLEPEFADKRNERA